MVCENFKRLFGVEDVKKGSARLGNDTHQDH